MMRKPRVARRGAHGPLARFCADVRATSAIEFALVAPILATLAMGAIELQRYQRTARQLVVSAETIADLVAQRDTNHSDLINVDFNAIEHLFPPGVQDTKASGGWWGDVLSHQVSHVRFQPTVGGCTQNCVYKAELLWNWPFYDTGPGAGPLRRACGELTPVDNNVKATGSTLPRAMFAAGSAVVVDLRYIYKPLFGSSLFAPVIMERQGYSFARFATPYVRIPNGDATRCPGYS